jgi:hypothetical protein
VWADIHFRSSSKIIEAELPDECIYFGKTRRCYKGVASPNDIAFIAAKVVTLISKEAVNDREDAHKGCYILFSHPNVSLLVEIVDELIDEDGAWYVISPIPIDVYEQPQDHDYCNLIVQIRLFQYGPTPQPHAYDAYSLNPVVKWEREPSSV